MRTLLALHGVERLSEARPRPMRDFCTDHRWLSINTATVRAQWPLDRIIDGMRAHAASARSRRGATRSPRSASTAHRGAAAATPASSSPAIAAAACFPAPTPPARRAALDDNRRAIDEAKTLDAPCLVLVVGGLPGALAGQPAHKDIAAARREVRDGIAATLDYARDGRHAARDRAAAPDVCGRPRLRQHARARARPVRRARPGAQRRARRRGRRLPRLVGSEARAADRARRPRAAAGLPRLRLAGADARPAERPRHDGRRRHRHPAHPRLGRGRGLRRLQRGRDLLAPRTGGSATAPRCSTPASRGTAARSDPANQTAAATSRRATHPAHVEGADDQHALHDRQAEPDHAPDGCRSISGPNISGAIAWPMSSPE